MKFITALTKQKTSFTAHNIGNYVHAYKRTLCGDNNQAKLMKSTNVKTNEIRRNKQASGTARKCAIIIK